MPKKKVIAAWNLKDWTKFTTQIKDKTKKNETVFVMRHLCASVNSIIVLNALYKFERAMRSILGR